MKAFSGQRSKWQDVSILYLDGATVTVFSCLQKFRCGKVEWFLGESGQRPKQMA